MNIAPVKSFLHAGMLVCLSFSCQGANANDAATDDASALRHAQVLSFNCFTCHTSAHTDAAGIPSLADLSASEIRDKMLAFKNDAVAATIMNRIAKGYSDAEIAMIANYIANHRAEHLNQDADGGQDE